MMIRKKLVTGEFDSGVTKGEEKAVRIPDAAEGERSPDEIHAERAGQASRFYVVDRIKAHLRVKNRRIRVALDGALETWRIAGARDHYQVRARKCALGFAQPAGGQQTPASEGIAGVNEHDVHIAVQLQMLEAVIEDKPIYPALCEERASS